MKTILTFIIGAIVILPTLLVLNESDDLWVNFLGFAYIAILFLISTTKVGKKGLKCLCDANNELAKRLGI